MFIAATQRRHTGLYISVARVKSHIKKTDNSSESSPEKLHPFSLLIGWHRAQCWTDCEAPAPPQRLWDSGRAPASPPPDHTTPAALGSAAAPSAAPSRHSKAGFQGSTVAPAPQTYEESRQASTEMLKGDNNQH